MGPVDCSFACGPAFFCLRGGARAPRRTALPLGLSVMHDLQLVEGFLCLQKLGSGRDVAVCRRRSCPLAGPREPSEALVSPTLSDRPRTLAIRREIARDLALARPCFPTRETQRDTPKKRVSANLAFFAIYSFSAPQLATAARAALRILRLPDPASHQKSSPR